MGKALTRTLTVVAVVVIVVIVALSVVFMPQATGANMSIGEQENKIVAATTPLTISTTITPKAECVDDDSLTTVELSKDYWSLDNSQIAEMNFFDGCQYQKLPAWKIRDAEGYVDAQIMAYQKDPKREVVLKNMGFKKFVHLDYGVKVNVTNNTEIFYSDSEGIKCYSSVLDNPMNSTEEELFLFYFYDDEGIIGVGWGDENTGVLKKFDTSGSGDGYSGGNSVGGDSGGPADDDSGDYTGDSGGPADDDSGDYTGDSGGPADTPS